MIHRKIRISLVAPHGSDWVCATADLDESACLDDAAAFAAVAAPGARIWLELSEWNATTLQFERAEWVAWVAQTATTRALEFTRSMRRPVAA